ncbi:MAG: 2-amino-4-hydroxy-6-hydroxymethyldihydropteridine diphosphokinase [Spirochaetia bacterium]|nr:2-amino-4-hydroxy-6-hydroxymethyldihydropteridine diphosphokinase [Spirochaetia bacterium]
MAEVFLGVGSNMGCRQEHIRTAFRRLRSFFPAISSSSLYETAPMYRLDQPDFLNCVFRLETDMAPMKLLELIHRLEDESGRDRQAAGYKGPRPLDIDILLYGDMVSDDPVLTLPHPGMKERAFVLVPLLEIAPDSRDPVSGDKYSNFLSFATVNPADSLIYLKKDFLMEEEKEQTAQDGLRLQVYMARCGVGSRRACDSLIQHGMVRVNGRLVTEMGVKVFPGDVVEYRGRKIYPDKKKVYIAFNKPVKVLCTSDDPEGRTLALDFFKDAFPYRLHNVGRLDYMSSGLIFYTNDGDFTKAVSHPSAETEKEYIVETSKPVPEELMMQFCKGFVIEGEKYRIKSYQMRSPVKIHIVLTEGKNREIRRFFQFHSFKIKKLHRIRIGKVRLDSALPPGGFRELTPKEVACFIHTEDK